MPPPEAVAAFLCCCGSRRWAEAMARGRPYASEPALVAAAEQAFEPLERGDWLEAFAHHPRIGDRAALAGRFSPAAGPGAGERAAAAPAAHASAGQSSSGQSSAAQSRTSRARAGDWAAAEQGALASAGEDVLESLLRGNREYEARFGYIFIVCATGRSAGEMLALLQDRLANDPAAELAIAAAEQRKITAIRLRKLLSEGS